VRRVALCAGAGDSLLAHPEVLGADVYITSDLRHHPASEARESARVAGGPALLDVSHWAAEWLWLDTAAEALRAAVPELTVTVSELRTDPWDFALV
jgi:putative NIF3 family GTP cyclohydrolase 1 type 2